MFVKTEISRRKVVRSAESKIDRLINSWLAVWNVLSEISTLSRWRTKIVSCVSPDSFSCRKIPYETNFHNFYWKIVLGVDLMMIHYSDQYSRMRSLVWGRSSIRLLGVPHSSAFRVFLVSSPKLLTCSTVFWSMARSSVSVIVLCECNFFRQSSCFQFVSTLCLVFSDDTRLDCVHSYGKICKIVLLSVFLFSLGPLVENFVLRH